MLDGKYKSSYQIHMNKLDLHKRVMILTLLVEGMSMRAVSRTVGVSINTVTKLLEGAGRACAEFHDATVRNVSAGHVQCDEIWSFCYAKEKNVATAKAAPEGAGDVWTWTAIDRDTKLILAFEVGDRSVNTAVEFMENLSGRLARRHGSSRSVGSCRSCGRDHRGFQTETLPKRRDS